MENGGIGRAEMLFSSSLVALVGSGDRPAFSPRRLRLWNTKKDHTICEVNFLTAVLSVKLNRKRVAVCLKTALHLFDISDMNCLRTLETAPNPDGVMALSPNEDNCHLAFPDGEKKASGSGGSSRGEVILYDALDLKVLNKVVACRSRVVAVSFSPDGKLLATASEQGTVIRIFTVPAAVKTFTLRRGSTTCGIYSMAFNAAATRLAVSSSNRTIHIFDVSPGASAPGGGGSGGGNVGGDRGRESRRSNRSSRTAGGLAAADGGLSPDGSAEGGGSNRDMRAAWRRGGGDVRGTEGSVSGGGLASGFRSVVGMLPNGVTKRVQDYVDCNRSFASVRLRQSAGRSICALIPAGESGVRVGRGGAARPGDGGGGNGNENDEDEGEILLVVTNEGILYSYAVDTVRGGECRLEQASSLLMDPNASQEIGSELFGPERRAPPVLAGQG